MTVEIFHLRDCVFSLSDDCLKYSSRDEIIDLLTEMYIKVQPFLHSTTGPAYIATDIKYFEYHVNGQYFGNSYVNNSKANWEKAVEHYNKECHNKQFAKAVEDILND